MKTVHILLSSPLLISLCFSSSLALEDSGLDHLDRPIWEENLVSFKYSENIQGLSYGHSMTKQISDLWIISLSFTT